MTSEEQGARLASEEVNQAVRLADLEQKYVDLEKDRQVWFDKAKAEEVRIAELLNEKEKLQELIDSLRSDLSGAKSLLQEEKDKVAEAQSNSRSQSERASRLEAEADNLREEIGYVTAGRVNIYEILGCHLT
jgi:chromosome segregation ATPase